ncbi:MAG TPA: orotidine-5'-phosphate decarboxylase [Tepidisphaeraceae bacterium]|nr:orotidine-5'-phosphate decarboxylase [Tepidisphaeraceae bacterium]
MPDAFSDRLLDAIDKTAAPVCVGIDPVLENLPASIRDRCPSELTGTAAAVDCIYDFSLSVLKTVAGLTPIVKIQSAYFEKYQTDGVEAYHSLVHEARNLGLLVIGDVKRGDMSTTATAYAQGHVTDAAAPDAITINPMLGLGALMPFVTAANAASRGLFVLVRTSNPDSAMLQDVKLADGRTWSEMLAEELNKLAGEHIGRRGYSLIGAVVGATQESAMAAMRARLPRSILLLPGYGAQGATAAMTRAAFQNGTGAIVSASRSVIFAHAEPKYSSRFGGNWQKCVEQSLLDMKQDLKQVLGG